MVSLFLAAHGEQIEVGTVAPDPPSAASLPTAEYHEEELTLPPAPVTLDFKGPGLFGPDTGLGRSKHQLCVQLQVRINTIKY